MNKNANRSGLRLNIIYSDIFDWISTLFDLIVVLVVQYLLYIYQSASDENIYICSGQMPHNDN